MGERLLSLVFLLFLFLAFPFESYSQCPGNRPTPVVDISGTTTICQGETATITFEATPDTRVAYKINSGANQITIIPSNGLRTINTDISSTFELAYIEYIQGNNCRQTITGSATVTVLQNATISNPSNKNQQICYNSALANINFNIGGGGTGATVSGLPQGLNGLYSNGVFSISGNPIEAGTFNYTVNTTGNCIQTSQT